MAPLYRGYAVAGVKLQRPGILASCCIEIAHRTIHIPDIDRIVIFTRFQFDRALEVFLCFGEILRAVVHIQETEIVVGNGLIRSQLDRFFGLSAGLGLLVLPGKHAGIDQPRTRCVRIGIDKFFTELQTLLRIISNEAHIDTRPQLLAFRALHR